MKKTNRKLGLNKESIRRLNEGELGRAAGAATQLGCEPTLYTCTCPEQCWISYRCLTERCITRLTCRYC